MPAVCELLAQHGEGMELAAIADQLNIPRSAVHRLLADLVRRRRGAAGDGLDRLGVLRDGGVLDQPIVLSGGAAPEVTDVVPPDETLPSLQSVVEEQFTRKALPMLAVLRQRLVSPRSKCCNDRTMVRVVNQGRSKSNLPQEPNVPLPCQDVVWLGMIPSPHALLPPRPALLCRLHPASSQGEFS